MLPVSEETKIKNYSPNCIRRKGLIWDSWASTLSYYGLQTIHVPPTALLDGEKFTKQTAWKCEELTMTSNSNILNTGLVLKVLSAELLLEVCQSSLPMLLNINLFSLFCGHHCSASAPKITSLNTTVSGSLHLLHFQVCFKSWVCIFQPLGTSQSCALQAKTANSCSEFRLFISTTWAAEVRSTRGRELEGAKTWWGRKKRETLHFPTSPGYTGGWEQA